MSKQEKDLAPEEYERRAEKALSGGKSFFASFLGGGSKTEEAAGHYENAGVGYRNNRQYKEAGRAFERSADLYDQTDNGFLDSRGPRQSALEVYELGDMVDDAARAGNTLLKQAKTSNHHTSAAIRISDRLGALYERAGDTKRAVQMYEESGDMHKAAGTHKQANRQFAKAAELAAESGDYRKGFEAFMHLGDRVVNLATVEDKGSCPWLDHYFRAAICQFADSEIDGVGQTLGHIEQQWSKLAAKSKFWQRPQYDRDGNRLNEQRYEVDKAEERLGFLGALYNKVKDGEQTAFLEILKSYRQPLPSPAGAIIQRIIQAVEQPQEDFS